MEQRTLLQILKILPTQEWSELEFRIQVLPVFFMGLDFDPSSLQFEYTVGAETGLRVYDAALVDKAGRAVLLVETKATARPLMPSDEGQLAGILERLKSDEARHFLLITPYAIVLVSLDGTTWIDLRDVNEDDVVTLQRWIQPVRKLLDEGPPFDTAFGDQDDDCLERISAIERASSNEEKKTTLESFLDFIIGRQTGLAVKYRNLRTASSEIDLVALNTYETLGTALDDHGRHLLIECKNWADPVGAKEVRDFVGKLLKSKITLGLLVSRNGVTGQHPAADGLREIRFCFDTLGISVVVLSLKDLRLLCLGRSLIELVDRRHDRLTFDLP